MSPVIKTAPATDLKLSKPVTLCNSELLVMTKPPPTVVNSGKDKSAKSSLLETMKVPPIVLKLSTFKDSSSVEMTPKEALTVLKLAKEIEEISLKVMLLAQIKESKVASNSSEL